MKAVGTHGDVAGLSVVDIPDVKAAVGEVRVRVHASAVNSADLKIIDGSGAARFLHAKVSPLVPGYDVSGVIETVGDGVSGLAVGDAVFGHLPYSGKTRQGAFSEHVTLAANDVAAKPDGVSHIAAASSATVGLTALQALRDKARVSEGARVLVLGASGGVGSIAVGVGKRLGCHVTAVCSTYAVDFVHELGADQVVDRKQRDPLEHQQPFDAIFDTTGLYSYTMCARALGPSGVLVTTLPSGGFVLGKIKCLWSARRCELVIVQSRRADLEQLGAWLADGLNVPIAHELPVRDAAAALQRLVSGGVLGKIAIGVVEGFVD